MKIEEKKLSWKEVLHRGHFLYFGYYKLYTMYMDHKIAGHSLEGLICNEEDQIFPVQSASYRVLNCLIAELHIHRDDIFVDIGCGWGRLIGFLKQKGLTGCRAVGIEINQQAAASAKKIFREAKDVEIICGDATKTIVKDATVYFMFNPFGQDVLNQFLDHIEKNCDRKIRVYYLHAVFETEFQKRTETWRLLKRTQIKPRHHIPLILCEYEFDGSNKKGKIDEIFKKS